MRKILLLYKKALLQILFFTTAVWFRPYRLKRSVISVSDFVQFNLMNSLRFWVRSNSERLIPNYKLKLGRNQLFGGLEWSMNLETGSNLIRFLVAVKSALLLRVFK